jgi:ferric-dicitrate binding protein FerR (iron transport regulator)
MIGLFTLYHHLLVDPSTGTSVLIQTELGNRSFVMLPDSTKVWLNSKSQIRYDADFGKANRKIALSGEGYFDVVHNNRPFIVNVGEFEIRVHGTRFNVCAYPEDKKIYTCLESGMISIKKGIRKNLEVASGQLVVYDKNKAEFDVSRVNTREYSSWRQNGMYLHAESLQVLAKKLERKYNVEIIFVPEELGHQVHYSGVFTDENIEEILDAISIASDLNYTKKGNRYEIALKRKNPD